MGYLNLVTCMLFLIEFNKTPLNAFGKIIKLEAPENVVKDQEVAYSEKTVYHVVPSFPTASDQYSYPVPVLKTLDHGTKVYELHPVPMTISSNYAYISPKVPAVESVQPSIQPFIDGNPLVTALLLSGGLGVPAVRYQGTNHPELIPANPYIALLLSQYGRYLPLGPLGGKGIYFYSAANNFHNNKPFGSYKVHDDA